MAAAGDAVSGINGGLLYHEVQEGKLCAVHCVNCVLQGPFFSEFDLAALAADLDSRERLVLSQGSLEDGDGGGVESHNVSLGGDFSIQVLEKAMEVWDLQIVPLNAPAAEASQYDPELETAFICHLHDHWFCIRKINGEWYNFNSLYPAPEHLSKFYLSAYLDTLKGSGWSIFTVRGRFPTDCPMASEASNSFGQWLTADDAKRITQSCKQAQAPPRGGQLSSHHSYTLETLSQMERIAAQEEEDLNAAIAASLADSAGAAGSIASNKHSNSRVLENDAAVSGAAVECSSIVRGHEDGAGEPNKRCKYDSLADADAKDHSSDDKIEDMN